MFLWNYLIRRAAGVLVIAWLAVTLAFIALRIIPGDPIASQFAQSGLSDAKIAELADQRRAELGLNRPLPVQYALTILGMLQGDLGRSLVSNRPVSQIIAEQIGPTIALAAGGIVIAAVLGIGLGVLTATARSPWLRRACVMISAVLLASPIYWTGTLAIYVFSVWLRVLPSSGGGDFASLILPWLVLGISASGSIARVTTASVDDIRSEDFVRTARAKGLPEQAVIRDHILRAGLAPIISVVALQAGFLLGGAVVTEAIFVRPGLGHVLLSAISSKDFAVVQGIVVLSAVVYTALNALGDLIAATLDPRLRMSLHA